MNLSGVSFTFNAHHFDPIMHEGKHEHTWTVTIWRKSEPWTDGRSALAALETFIDAIAPMQRDETRQLPQELWTNEALARAALVLGNVVRVNVDRKGFHAEAWA